jgi:hypothetical protein
MSYYIYIHITLQGEPFYVGRGKGNRAYIKKGRSEYWNNIVNKYDYDILLLENNLNYDDACNLERYWIKRIGRIDKGEGKLINFTDGGDGGSHGIIMTDERREKHRTLKGKSYIEIYGHERAIEMIEKRKLQKGISKPKVSTSKKGIPRDEDTKQKISNSLKGRPNLSLKGKSKINYRKPIYQIDLDGNIIKEWESLSNVYSTLKIQISRALKLGKTCNGFYWKYKK